MKKKLFLIGLLLTASIHLMAQTTAPKWKSGYFQELRNSYLESVSAVGRNIEDARSKAAAELVIRRNMATGVSVQVKVENGQISTQGDDRVVLKSRIIDEYVETLPSGEYRVYLLTQTAKHPDNSFEPVAITDEYPFSARAFVPGMQQIYKGQTGKGVAFISAEVLAVGGILVAESMRSNYENMKGSTHNAQQQATYIDNANNMQNVRNVFIGAAAAVYIWNVIDAITSKGGRYVKVGNGGMAFIPYATGESVGLALNIKF